MALAQLSWRGSAAVVDADKVMRRGALYVAESRIREMSKWPGAIISVSFANPVLYLLAVGIGIGSLVSADGIDGVPYLTFLGPALLGAAAIQAAMDETMFPTMDGFKWGKKFFAANATPLTPRQIVHGVLLGSMVRTLLAVVAYFVVLLAFGAILSPRAWLAIPMAMLAGLAFATAIMAITAYVLNDDGFFALIGRFVITPMFLFSGTYYPLSSMPEYLQWIGWISPLWHATEMGRFLTYGHEVAPLMIGVHMSYFVVVLAVSLFFCYRRFTSRLGA